MATTFPPVVAGSGVPDSRISVYKSGALTVPDAGVSAPIPWALDAYPDDGTGDLELTSATQITAKGGGKLYLVQAYASLTPVNGATSLNFNILGANEANGDGITTGSDQIGSVLNAKHVFWFFAIADAALTAVCRTLGATGNETLGNAGIDIVRIR